MKFFDSIYKQLFGQQNSPEFNGKKYLVQESYGLSESEKQEFDTWNMGADCSGLCHAIFNGLRHKKAGLSESNQRFSIYESPQSNGFYMLCEDFLDSRQSKFMLEYFKEKLISLSYYLNHSSRDIFEQKGNVNTRLRYYLKPKLANLEMPLEQKYGNIHLEYLSINDKPDYIKLMANVYSDRNYQDAESFDELLFALEN